MAYSSSIKRAQAIKLCELCNEDSVKWRCIDCARCLCEKCKTIHLNVPVTAKHQIVSISTPIKEVQRKVVTDNIPCKDHVKKIPCLFCETCDCLVCPECVATSHKKHQFIQTEKALDGKLEQLEHLQAKVSDNLKLCDSKTQEIQNLMPKYQSIFDESLTKIQEKEQELKHALSKYSKVLQDKVEVERSKVKTIVTKVEQEVTGARKRLEDISMALERVLTSNKGQDIFDTTLTVPGLKFDPLPQNVESFTSKAKIEKQIEELFGSFETLMIPAVQPEFGFEVLRTFTTDLPTIHQVRPLDETSAWISYNTSTKSAMRKVIIQDNNITKTSEITLKIYDMALTSDNDILLTMAGKSDVKLMMTKTGEIKTLFTVAPLLPNGIHVTSDNKVIVGVKEPGNTYTPTDQSQRAVLVYGMDGKQEHKYQYDRDGKSLFTIPLRITTINNQDILVIDVTSSKAGRVVTLDREGKLRWIYKGHSKINDTISFAPEGITTTMAGYIIVSDYNSHALHVLSEYGDVLTCKVMGDKGILYPWGLNMDRGRNLWVVCGTGGKDSGAKLHIVKLMLK